MTRLQKELGWVVAMVIFVGGMFGLLFLIDINLPKEREPEFPPAIEEGTGTNSMSSPSAVQAVAETAETEGARKLRELGFDPMRGHAIKMVVKSNGTNKNK